MPRSTHPADGLFYIDHDVLARLRATQWMCARWKNTLRRAINKSPDNKFVITHRGLTKLVRNNVWLHNYDIYFYLVDCQLIQMSRTTFTDVPTVMDGLLDLARSRGLVA